MSVLVHHHDGRTHYTVHIASTPADLAAVYRLRKRVYVDERGMLPADHPWVDGDRLVDSWDARSRQLLCMADGEAVGTLRLTPARLGPLELEAYLDLSRFYVDRDVLVEGARFAVRGDWCRRGVGALVAYAGWRALAMERDACTLVVAGKLGPLDQVVRPVGFRPRGDPFHYELSRTPHQLVEAKVGCQGSMRRLSWHLRAEVAHFTALRAQPLVDLVYGCGHGSNLSRQHG